MIALKNLYKSFGKLHVLQGTTLDIPTGTTQVILGQSGSGKSVILKHIAGLLDSDQGKVIIDGKNPAQMTPDEVDAFGLKFGFLFQGAALFDSLPVWENVVFALQRYTNKTREELRAIADERLNWVGLHNVLDKMPSELSGGMRKRVGLARAIANDPEYMLYDEPTTGLDPIMSEVINDLMISLRERLKMTSIVVTHDMHSAFKVGDHMAMLYRGEILLNEEASAFKNTDNQIIQQFIQGKSEGPFQLR